MEILRRKTKKMYWIVSKKDVFIPLSKYLFAMGCDRRHKKMWNKFLNVLKNNNYIVTKVCSKILINCVSSFVRIYFGFILFVLYMKFMDTIEFDQELTVHS